MLGRGATYEEVALLLRVYDHSEHGRNCMMDDVSARAQPGP